MGPEIEILPGRILSHPVVKYTEPKTLAVLHQISSGLKFQTFHKLGL